MQQRGVAIIKARKASSAFSAAIVACDHIRDWVFGTPKVDSLSPQIAFDHADLNYLPLRFCFFFCFFFLLLSFVILPLALSIREHGFPWESILMVLMGFHLA